VDLGAEPHLLWRDVVGLEQEGNGWPVITFEDLAVGHVNEELTAPLQKTRGQAVGIDLPGTPYGVPTVVQLP
jgi:hypothetical protein